MSDADELVRQFIARRFRSDGRNRHLRSCPDLTFEDVDAYDGLYGCDTGCEFARFEAVVSCPHGESESFEWGDFGTMDWIIEAMVRADERAQNPPEPEPPLVEYVQVPVAPPVTVQAGDMLTVTFDVTFGGAS